jgi:hypothetical protein
MALSGAHELSARRSLKPPLHYTRRLIEAAIVSGSAFIAMEKTNLAPLGVALHGIAIAAGFLALLATISTPPAFVGVTAAMAAASILVTAKGDKLRHLSKGQA